MSITSVLKFVPSSLISLWPFDLRRSILQDISGDLDAMVSHNHAKSTHSPADFRETTSARCKWMTQFQTGLFVFFCKTDIDPTHLDNETCLHHVQQEIHVQKIQKIYFSLAILLKFDYEMYLISNYGNHCIRIKATSHLPRVCLISS